MVTARGRAALWAGSSALWLALGACSDTARCKPIERCDVRTRACQRAALQHAICLRGRDEPADLDLPVVLLAREDYLERVRQDAAETSEAAEQMRAGLALFDLAAPTDERVEARVERARRVAGFYEPAERRITVVDGGAASDSAGYVLTLVHEFVHALQDAAGELDAPVRSFDRRLAHGALVEGEATLLTDEAALEGYGFSFSGLDYGRALAKYRESALARVTESSSPFDAAYGGVAYAFGASYLWPLRRDGGAAAIGEAFVDPPLSTYAVMNADPSRPALRENDLGDVAAPVLPALTRVGCYRLGRFLYEVKGRRVRGYLPGGENFVADSLCVFVDEAGSVGATWRIRYSTEVAAEQALPTGMEGVGQRDGADVWWARGLSMPLRPSMAWEAAPALDFGFEEEPSEAPRIECPEHTAHVLTRR